MNSQSGAGDLAVLSAEQREAISQVWLGRARGELETARVFELLDAATRTLGAASEVVELTARAAQDELRHSELCRELAEHYAARSLPPPAAAMLEPPRFGSAPANVNGHLWLIYQSCLNEGIACAYLQENLHLARAPEVRRVIRRLLRDDLVHARIGWAHLASAASSPVRGHIAAALPTLIRLARDAWLRPGNGSDLDCPEHGCLGHSRHAEIVDAALRELILPGFAQLGF